MLNRKFLIVMGLAVFALAQSVSFAGEASAQMHRKSKLPGDDKPKKEDFVSNDHARRVLADFTRCAAKKDKDRAREFVMGDVSERSLVSDSDFLDPYCLNPRDASAMSFYAPAMIGTMAEYLIDKDFDGLVPRSFDGVEMPEGSAKTVIVRVEGEIDPETGAPDLSGIDLDSVSKFKTQTDLLVEIGECLVRKHQPPSLALLDTKIGSSSELDAVRTLAPLLSDCASNNSMSIDMTALRTAVAVAVAYYRLSVAERASRG